MRLFVLGGTLCLQDIGIDCVDECRFTNIPNFYLDNLRPKVNTVFRSVAHWVCAMHGAFVCK